MAIFLTMRTSIMRIPPFIQLYCTQSQKNEQSNAIESFRHKTNFQKLYPTFYLILPAHIARDCVTEDSTYYCPYDGRNYDQKIIVSY